MGPLEKAWERLLGRREWAVRGGVLQSLRTLLPHPHLQDTTLHHVLHTGLAAYGVVAADVSEVGTHVPSITSTV
jgi:hypothetical protein